MCVCVCVCVCVYFVQLHARHVTVCISLSLKSFKHAVNSIGAYSFEIDSSDSLDLSIGLALLVDGGSTLSGLLLAEIRD